MDGADSSSDKPFVHDLESAVNSTKSENTGFNRKARFISSSTILASAKRPFAKFYGLGRLPTALLEPLEPAVCRPHSLTNAEKAIGVEGRGQYYEKAGAVRGHDRTMFSGYFIDRMGRPHH